MKIKYVGVKVDGETAFAHLSGVALWMDGDEYEIKDDVAKRMLQHPDVFALADKQEPDTQTTTQTTTQTADTTSLTLTPGAEVKAPESTEPKDPAEPVASITVEGKVIVLDGLGKDELHDLAKRLGVAVHHASGPDKVIAALQAAFPATAE